MNSQEAVVEQNYQSKKRRKMVTWILVGVLVIAFLTFLTIGTMTRGLLPVGSWGKVGEPAPDFQLVSLDGDMVALEDLKGKPLVLSFGASWCPHCQRELPSLQAVHERYPDVQVVLVDIEETEEPVRAFTEDYNLKFQVLLDISGDVSRDYGVFRIPSLFFVDSQGVVQAHMNRYLTEDEFTQHLADLGVAVTTP